MAIIEALALIGLGVLAGATIYGVGKLFITWLVGEIFEESQDLMFEHVEWYSLTGNDNQYVEKSKKALIDAAGNDPINKILSMDADGRCQVLEKILDNLKALYKLEDINIELAFDEKSTICGYFDNEENTMVINCVYLFTDSGKYTKIFLATIFHEFRHAVQHRMVEADDENSYEWYSGEDSVRKMAENFLPGNYISSNKNMEQYWYQYVEVDAREIATYILEDYDV